MSAWDEILKELEKSEKEQQPEPTATQPAQKSDADTWNEITSSLNAGSGSVGQPAASSVPSVEPFQLRMAKAGYEKAQQNPATQTQPVTQEPFQLQMAKEAAERKKQQDAVYAALLPGYKPPEQTAGASAGSFSGRGGSFSGSAGKIDGGSQAYVNGEKVVKDTRSGFEKFLHRMVGYDPNKVTGEKTDVGKLIGGTILKGVNGFSRPFWHAADWVLGDIAQDVHDIASIGINSAIDTSNSLFGTNFKEIGPSDNFITRMRKDADANEQAFHRTFYRNANSSAAAQIVDKLGTATVQAVPFLIETMLTAGLSVPGQSAEAASAALNYASGMGQASAAEATGLMLKHGIDEAVRNPAFWTSYVQSAAPSYEAAKEEGVDDTTAMLYGLTNGFFNALIEIGGGIQDLDSSWWRRALDEGKEEVFQGFVERGLKAPATNAPLVSLDPEDTKAVINPATAAEEAFGGAAVGGLLSGFGIGSRRGSTGVNAQQQAQTETPTTQPATEAAQEAAGTREASGGIPAAPATETAPTGETERLNTATVSEAEAEPHVYEEPAAEQPTETAPAATEPTAEPAAFAPKAETLYNPKTKRGKLEMKAARELREETSLWNNNEDAAAAVHRVADSMRDKGRWTDVMAVARKAADEMLKKFKSGIESGDRELYNNLRAYLRAQRIEISPELRGDTTDYNEWRKSVFGQLRLAKSGLPIDTVYQELSQTFGQGLFPENVTAHSDMLARILNVLDAAKPAALMMDEAFSPDDYNVLLEATAGSLAKAAAKTVGGKWAGYEPGAEIGFKSEAAKRYDAIQTEIETAKWDGEDISEEEAAARVDAFYQQYGVYNPSEILSHEEATDGDQYDEQGTETAVEPGDVPAETERPADAGAEQDGAAGVQRVAEPDVSAERDSGDGGAALVPAGRDGRPDVGNPSEVSLEEQPGMKRSQTESNTLSGVAGKLGGEQNPLYYMPVTERQTLTEAVNRVTADGVGEMERLAGKEHWTAADVDTAMTLYGKLQADGVRNRDFGAAQSWGKVIQQRGTSTAQALQAFSKWTRSGAGTASQIRQQLDGEVEAYQISDGRRGLSPEQADRISNDVYDFAQTFDSLAEDDAVGLRELIKRMSDYRGTGTFFEKNFMKLLNRQTDMDYLREYALRQMQAIASDATDTADIGQKLKTWQVNAQLTRLGTFFRNLGGNAAFGIQDTLTQDGLGIALDRLISRKTGKRTVALDKSWLSSKARKQAMESLRRSVLEIAGDVNMSGDETRYGTNASNRTFKMNGNGFDRFMSRWEQLLGYSLQSSDAFFRGKQEAAVREGLDNIDSGLTEEQKTQLAEGTADYRLFQNKGTAYGLSKGAHDLLNLVGVGGEVDAAHPQRGRQGGFGLGDMANPYPGVPANLGAKVLEYSPANIVKGSLELVKVLKSVEMGTYDPAKQQQAVMDIARGMAGTPIILALAAAFKSGVVKNSDDEDDLDAAAQNRAEGKTGVQINLGAWERGLRGEPTDWKDGDKLMSIGWLEPLNGFMAIASMLAEDDSGDPSLEVYARHYIDGALQSIREIPAMQSISNIYDTLKYSTGETLGDKVKDAAVGFAGDALTGMIPAPVSQTAKTIDPYYRDTSGDSKYEQVWNSIRNAIPGLRETLPVKQDNYGEPKKGQDSAALRALNNLVLPGAVNELHQSEVSAAVSGLYERTGDEKVVPDRKAPGSVRVDGESHRLTAEEKREWQSEYGKAFGDMAGAFLLSADYDGLTDEQKAAVVEEVGALATYRARRDLYKALGADYNNKSMQKLADLADADRDDAVRYLAAREIVEGALAGENFDALDQFLDDGGLYWQLSDRAKEMLGTVDGLTKLVKMHDEGLDAQTATSVMDMMDALEPTGDHRDVTQRQQTEAIIGSDLSEEQKMDAIRVYASESYAKKAEAAVGAGLPLDKWGEIYGKYADIDDLDLSASQKVDRFTAALDKDKSLTDKQREVLLDQLKYFQMVPAEAKRYRQLKDAGMDIDTAVKVADEMRGAENQSEDVDRILAAGWSEADQWRALKVYTSESYYNKAAEAYRRGIDLPDYVRMFREADQPNDEGKRSGSLSKEELWDFYKKDPGNEDFVRIMWMLNGSTTSWDAYKARHGG